MQRVVSSDVETSVSLTIQSGVKQWCLFEPILFAIFFFMLLRFAFTQSKASVYLPRRSNGNLAHLRANTKMRTVLIREKLFADDAALAMHTKRDLQQLINQLNHACKEFGTTVNIKTKHYGTRHFCNSINQHRSRGSCSERSLHTFLVYHHHPPSAWHENWQTNR